MGLFFSKGTCSLCGNKEGKKKICDGFICKDCLRLCSIPFQVKINKFTTKELILNDIENNRNNKELLDKFIATKKVGKYIQFDEQNKKWIIPNGFFGSIVNAKVHDFKEIIEYELLEDGESVTKGGLGRAVVGGVLLGGVGAIVGGVTGRKKTNSIINSLKIKITLDDSSNPVAYINLINSPVKSKSIVYKTAYSEAQEILSILKIITENTNKNVLNKNENNLSITDELLKLKHLKDEGILTDEEFNIQKSKILNK